MKFREYIKNEEFISFYSNAKAPYNKLSNFAIINDTISIKKNIFISTEHAYQSRKFKDISLFTVDGKLTFENVGASEEYWMKKGNVGFIAKMATNDKNVKKFGLNKISGFNSNWKMWKKILKKKFEIDEFKNILLSTGDKYLLEFSRDAKNKGNYWGGIIENGILYGKNTMGKYLMKIRKKLQKSDFSEKREKPEKIKTSEKCEKPEKTEKPKKSEKSEKCEMPKKIKTSEKTEKCEKPEKYEKTEKPKKSEKSEKYEKPKKSEKSKKYEMSLSNVKVKYLRPKYENLKEWCEDKNNIYCGRGGIVFIDGERYPKKASIFANPYKNQDKSLEECLKQFKEYAENSKEIQDNLYKLKGKNLGCWCVPQTIYNYDEIDYVCHGQILMEMVEKTFKNEKI